MIRISKEELENYQPLINTILLKPNRGENEYLLPNGQTLLLDISFDPNMHAPVVGTVFAVPASLDVKKGGMQWETDMELRKGDVVCYSYESALAALEHDEGQIVECEGETFFIIPYEEVFVAKRRDAAVYRTDIPKGVKMVKMFANYLETGEMKGKGENIPFTVLPDQIIPVNGYCLIEPVEEIMAKHLSLISLETNREIRPSERFGKVAYISKGLIRKYVFTKEKPDTNEVKPGDYVCFDRAADLLCEYDLHASLDKKKKFFRMQRRLIFGIIPSHMVKDIQ